MYEIIRQKNCVFFDIISLWHRFMWFWLLELSNIYYTRMNNVQMHKASRENGHIHCARDNYYKCTICNHFCGQNDGFPLFYTKFYHMSVVTVKKTGMSGHDNSYIQTVYNIKKCRLYVILFHVEPYIFFYCSLRTFIILQWTLSKRTICL